MIPTAPLHPLKEVWLRPRRVFRELARQPIGIADYLLAAAQGVGNYLMLYQSQMSESHPSVMEIVGNALRIGPLAGIAGVFLFSLIYGRLSARAGGPSARNQVFHVLAYGGVPVAATLVLWGLASLLVGDAAFVAAPGAEVDGFVWIIVRAQFAGSALLLLWSVVLQVMGFSEILKLPVRKAFGLWVLGQLLGVLAAFFLAILIAMLLPGVVPNPP